MSVQMPTLSADDGFAIHAPPAAGSSSGRIFHLANPDGNTDLYFVRGGVPQAGLKLSPGGRVGIGNPLLDAGRLTVQMQGLNPEEGITLKPPAGEGPTARLFQVADGAGSTSFHITRGGGLHSGLTLTASGRIGINVPTAAQVESELTVNGTTRTGTLTITGGADLAEPFEITDDGSDSSELATAGTVVVIDPDRPGALKVSSTAFDSRVAGVISGANGLNPGMMMSATCHRSLGATGRPVALAGRVWCLCDADVNGGIKPGDRLTTSTTPGHAMRVAVGDHADGAVLGKAMTELKSGRGLVLVLVNLQ